MKSLLSPWIQRRQYLLVLLVSTVFACITVLPGQSQNPSETAHAASSFIDSLGVVVHLNRSNSAYRNYDSIIKPRLQELGVRHIRDGVRLDDRETQQKFVDLATVGIKSTLVMDPRDQQDASVAVDIVKAIPTAVEAVEGPNEWDVWPDLSYKGQPFPQGVRLFQSELFNAVKQDPATARLDVLSPTVALWHNATSLGEVVCDYGAMHSYPGGQPPTAGLDWHWIPSTRQICPDKPLIATETGWHNAVAAESGQPGISEAAAGKYVPRLWLEYFNRDIQRVYINEFIDKWQTADKEGNFGILRQNGTPKPAFTALKNLIALLRDGEGAFSPGALSYTMVGATTNVHHTLLQKRDGRFYLILWQEVPSFDVSNKRDISVPTQAVTVRLTTAIRSASLYQPLRSTDATARYNNPRSLVLNVADEPLVVELAPA
ncbi:hypothetical protein D0962_33620 [Leptolyngbyaceae cyanobacterium CCMR0082]|uniref:Uncharacterized protein n=1 Tax=Adonisia turfae CCMR0082 TaxID=2304604 RepID=A0A6M0SGY8_9CYAN|nr:hypothetical protein [Adonisia turfae]NEZ67644.1 hypothetical protein [Adonisia turfae CCMR0082]